MHGLTSDVVVAATQVAVEILNVAQVVVDDAEGQERGSVELYGAVKGGGEPGVGLALEGLALVDLDGEVPAKEAESQAAAQLGRDAAVAWRVGDDVDVAVDDHGRPR